MVTISFTPASLESITALTKSIPLQVITSLTKPANEAYPYHISTRNYDRPGWAYVSYWPAPGRRFSDEIGFIGEF